MDKDFIPYIAFESAQTRLERIIKRLWILCIITLVSLIASNAAWIYYESQWQYVQTSNQEIEQDGGGLNIISGGDTNYGATN